MNFAFENRPWIAGIDGRRHHVHTIRATIIRKVAVFIPCLLIGTQLSFGMDEWPESVDSLCVRCETRDKESTSVGPIMIRSVASGTFKESQRGGEGSPQLGTSSKESSSALTPKLEPVMREDAKQANSGSNQSNLNDSLHDDLWISVAVSLWFMFFTQWITWPREKTTPNVRIFLHYKDPDPARDEAGAD